MFRGLFIGAKELNGKGAWSDEQAREYCMILCHIERALELRLKEFAAAYDYTLTDDLNNGKSEPQQEHKQLGRKRKGMKDMIIPPNKDVIYSRLQENMKGASADVAMNILISWINNRTVLKPSYGTFIEAFPNVKIPESTYYDKLKKAGL